MADLFTGTEMWIRSPLWDGFWILSGLPLGVVFLAGIGWGGIHPQFIILWTALVMQTGHLLSPMGLAWTHEGFRRIMRRHAAKYVSLPLGILAGATAVAYGSSFYLPDIRFNPASFSLLVRSTTLAEFKNPFMAMVVIYSLWNAYHFGKQAFGIMSIYRHKANIGGAHTYGREQRMVDLIYCCVVIWATMLIPFVPPLTKAGHELIGWPAHPHPFLDYTHDLYIAVALTAIAGMLWQERRAGFCLPRVLLILTDGLGMIMAFWYGLWGFATIAVNHWLVAIGLASHVRANHREGSPVAFALVLMAVGMALFCLLFVNLGTLLAVGFTVDALHFTVTAVGLRLGLGFVHFLYDRWVYRLGDARVQATIGRDLFCPMQAIPGR